MTRSRIAMLFVVALACLRAPGGRARAERDRGRRERLVGRGAARRDRRGRSPALIEKSRSVTTDGPALTRSSTSGPAPTADVHAARFPDLQEGRDRTSATSRRPSTRLKVGALEESVTVSGASPVVDVQSNVKAQVLSREVLDAVPNAHTIQSVGQLILRRHAHVARRRRLAADAADLLLRARHRRLGDLADDGRHDHQRPAARRRDADLHERRRQPGNGVPHRRRQRRTADRRPADQHRPEGRRQPLQRPFFGAARTVAERQLRRRAEGAAA